MTPGWFRKLGRTKASAYSVLTFKKLLRLDSEITEPLDNQNKVSTITTGLPGADKRRAWNTWAISWVSLCEMKGLCARWSSLRLLSLLRLCDLIF